MLLLSSLNKKDLLYLFHSSLVSPGKGNSFVWQMPYCECPEAVKRENL